MKEYKYKINGMKFTVAVGDVVDNEVNVEVNGIPYKVELDRTDKKKQKPALAQSGKTNHGEDPSTKVSSKPAPLAPQRGSASAIKSPLPGTIMSIAVNVGDTVKMGDKVAVLEAMKMENDIRSDKAGVVKQIVAKAGDTVLEGEDILIIE